MRVVSKRKGGVSAASGETKIYIGRPHPLGNPFVMTKESDRLVVVAKYRNWLRVEYKKSKAVFDSLNDLVRRHKAGEQLALECWCAPLACHGDVVIEAVLKLSAKVE